MNENNTITFNIGKEYKPIREDYDQAKESYFRSTYERARQIVKGIVDSKESEGYNNIIAFVGDRGTGKTSSMLTFSALIKKNNFLKDGFKQSGDEYSKSQIHFEDLDTIDPSLFRDNSNILEIILARMFMEFKNSIEKDCSKGKEDDRRKIIDCFTKVHKNLNTLVADKKDILKCEPIDSLLKMSASTEIKKNIKNLIDEYLKFMGGTESKKYLLIKIDDIDLNTKHAYEMSEHIRKYLTLPNVVILMALKIDQLADAIKQNYMTEFKDLIKKERMKYEEIGTMTEKYLEKLIPQERRLYLPDFFKIDTNVKLEIIDGSDYFYSDDVEDGVRELIYKKTGMIFLKQKYHRNYIVPDNLRELNDLIVMLWKMKDVKLTSLEKCEIILRKLLNKQDIKLKKKSKEDTINFIYFDELLDLNDILYLDTREIGEFKDNLNSKIKIRNMFSEHKCEEIITSDEDEFEKIVRYIQSKINKENSEVEKEQLTVFKNYFIQNWCRNNLSNENYKRIENLLERDIRQKNKYIINEFYGLFKYIDKDKDKNKSDKDKNDKDKEYNNILNKENNPMNISLGDVLAILNRVSKYKLDEDTELFIFAIKTVYSMLLYDLYNSSDNKGKEIEVMKDFLKKDNYSRYDILIGGSVLNTKVNKILRNEQGVGSRDNRDMSYTLLKQYRTKKENENNKDKDKLVLLELFMSMFIKNMYPKDTRENNHREQEDIYYDMKYVTGVVKKFEFDITSFIFNVNNIGVFAKSDGIKVVNEKLIEDCNDFDSNKIDRFYIASVELLERLFEEDFKKINQTDKSSYGEYFEEYMNYFSKIKVYDKVKHFSFYNEFIFKLLRYLEDEVKKFVNYIGVERIPCILKDMDSIIENAKKDITGRDFLDTFFKTKLKEKITNIDNNYNTYLFENINDLLISQTEAEKKSKDVKEKEKFLLDIKDILQKIKTEELDIFEKPLSKKNS